MEQNNNNNNNNNKVSQFIFSVTRACTLTSSNDIADLSKSLKAPKDEQQQLDEFLFL